MAERILTIGHTPLHSYTDYLKQAQIKEAQDITEGRRAVELIQEAFKVIIKLQRDLMDLSSEANDEGTNALMSDYIREQEKLVWMYGAYLG